MAHTRRAVAVRLTAEDLDRLLSLVHIDGHVASADPATLALSVTVEADSLHIVPPSTSL